jgi:hypothetical protein
MVLRLAESRNFKITRNGRVQSVRVLPASRSFDGASKEEIKMVIHVNIMKQKERLFESEQAICQTKQVIATEKHLERKVSMNLLKCMMAARGFKAKSDKAQTAIDRLDKLLKEIETSSEEETIDYETRLEDILSSSAVCREPSGDTNNQRIKEQQEDSSTALTLDSLWP